MKIKGNQYLPNGFGKPAATYWYIVNEDGLYYHFDGKWRRKHLKEMRKYAFRSLEDAEKKLSELV